MYTQAEDRSQSSRGLDWENPDLFDGLKLLVEQTPSEHPYLSIYHELLGQALIRKFKSLGDLDDLQASLQNSQAALNLTRNDDPGRSDRLRDLATSLGYRYQMLGELRDLENALQNFQEALGLMPEGHNSKARCLQNLAVCFTLLYQRLGSLKDLGAAQDSHQAAIELALEPPLQDLAFRDRYQRLGDFIDPTAALQNFQALLNETPVKHSDRVAHLQSLAVMLGEKYQRFRDLNDLETALQIAQEVVGLTPNEHPAKAMRLQHLAESFQTRYEAVGDLFDLEAALENYQRALDLLPDDHPECVGCMHGLALCSADRYKQLRELKDLEAVKAYYNASFSRPTATPESSWKAALHWASFAEQWQPADSLSAYMAAFHLLPEIIWIGNSIPIRQDAIRRLDVGQVTSRAVKAYIDLSKLTSAVEVMEQGLSTTLQQILELKPNVENLRPDHADSLRRLSYELYSGTSADPRSIANERHNLLEDIRAQPGLKYFLQPKPYDALQRAAHGGPVIILNSHKHECDGIMILNSTSMPVHLPLPSVTLGMLQSQREILKALLGQFNVRSRGESTSSRLFGRQEWFGTSKTLEECWADLLTWLWTHVVCPVYQALEKHGIDHGRLWWLSTGAFTGLPLHACPPTDEFIHSYTPTLGSLVNAYTKKSSNSAPKLGIVGVTHTGPSVANSLKGVKEEVEHILRIASCPVECLQGEQATAEAVKHQLQECSWAHLACHGKQDLFEPTKSHLRLYGGILELDTILRMPLSNAEFVFLAACETVMGDTELENESFHLGGGFIAAGFQGAIGTLWSMNDQDGPLIAEIVYSHLFRGGHQPSANDAAEALQLAVKELKARHIPYERWIPFIHLGV
ncbi:CHAT domain-containing protein [Mycena latifolia]|nr:CHAT domain-containing protein [Mycena latifolia]